VSLQAGMPPGDALIRRIDEGLVQIDLQFGQMDGVIAAYLLHGGGEAALVEVGPTTTRAVLEAGVHAAGLEMEDVDRLLVTHIHLDHAGAAGPLMRDYPRLRLGVHPVGAPHLADPSRLVASATRIYGDQMGPLWGEVAPIPTDRIDVLTDGEALDVAGRRLVARFTPGHASHHVAFIDEASGTVFTGDVGGVRIQGTIYVCPPTPPPDIDPAAWAESVAILRAAGARRLALTHFGVFDDVDAHLDALMPNLDAMIAIAREELAPDGDSERLTHRLHALERAALGRSDPDAFTRLELATPGYMAALGLRRLLKQQG
jgi:glyoxylase-like metal-dependent hydrolase (beta-lactamase superfamily II)